MTALTFGHYDHQCAGPANSTAYAKQRCPQQVDTERAGLPYLAQSIASNPEPKNGEERENRDLAAQESTSVWGFWMLVISAAGVSITAIGTGFLLWQIQLTRQAVQDTGEATKAMIRQNEISEKTQRPYLLVENPRIVFVPTVMPVSMAALRRPDQVRPIIEYEIRNCGKGPAFLEIARYDVTVLDARVNWDGFGQGGQYPHVIVEGQTYNVPDTHGGRNFVYADIAPYLSDAPLFAVAIRFRIVYRDIFGVRRESRAAFWRVPYADSFLLQPSALLSDWQEVEQAQA